MMHGLFGILNILGPGPRMLNTLPLMIQIET